MILFFAIGSFHQWELINFLRLCWQRKSWLKGTKNISQHLSYLQCFTWKYETLAFVTPPHLYSSAMLTNDTKCWSKYKVAKKQFGFKGLRFKGKCNEVMKIKCCIKINKGQNGVVHSRFNFEVCCARNEMQITAPHFQTFTSLKETWKLTKATDFKILRWDITRCILYIYLREDPPRKKLLFF